MTAQVCLRILHVSHLEMLLLFSVSSWPVPAWWGWKGLGEYRATLPRLTEAQGSQDLASAF